MSSGFCFVTFSEHKAAVTAVSFMPNGNAVISASMDGTVMAFDLKRYCLLLIYHILGMIMYHTSVYI